MPSEFTHLHLHTQYSVLDGALKITNLVQRLKELGQSSVAMTDHGNMHGAIEFYQKTTKAGIKPIIGCEVYITAGSRFEKVPFNQGGPRTHHLTLLAMNMTGYKNLCKLVTLGYVEGFYFKPRIDKELLAQHSEGIICLSGCVSSELAAKARADDIEGARKLLNRYIEMFDDRLYLEIQPHKFDAQQKLNRMNYELSKEFKLPLVATNDCHYIHKDDAYSQEVLMCVSTGKLITDDSRMKHDSELYLKSYDEMLVDFQNNPEALDNTQKIADRCELEFDFSKHYMPQYDPHPEESIDILFEKSARKGLEKRYKDLAHYFDGLSAEVKKEYSERLDEEIGLILSLIHI